jgi:hypothetical protein
MSSASPRPWSDRLRVAFDAIGAEKHRRDYLEANADTIARAITGPGPDSAGSTCDAGVHMVVNVAAAHVPAFCEASRRQDPRPYMNCYDLQHRRIGDRPAVMRIHIDQSLPTAADYQKVCFGAIELNGTGVRFYGDFCLVLCDDLVEGDTVVLDRNSYDIERLPLSRRLDGRSEAERAAERKRIANELAGAWSDLAPIVAIKILDRLDRRLRRLTVGEISDGILTDEDYIEVPWLRPSNKEQSFGSDDLLEVRVSAADVALEERIRARAWAGPAPSLAELTWGAQRRKAEDALNAATVPVKVVTTAGRVRA